MVIMYHNPMQRFWFFIYWLLLVVSFCGIGFWLVAAAQGYRYNTEVGRWQKTGMLIARSDPRDATLEIGRQQYPLSRSSRVPNILPGSYRLRIVKKGYASWEKTITIQPGFVVGLDEVVLFIDEPKALVNSQEYESLLPFYNVADNRLTIIDGELRRGTNLISRFVNPPTAAKLLSTDRHLVYIQGNELRLMATDGLHDQLLYEGVGLDPKLLVVFNNDLIGIREQGKFKVLKIR